MIELRFRRGTSVQWDDTNIILKSGEPAYSTDTGVFKIGDGHSTWQELSSYLTLEEFLVAINQIVEDAVTAHTVDGADYIALLDEHVNSNTPHPVYDDGPSLYLLYQNAKV